jgi:hypothetical protein
MYNFLNKLFNRNSRANILGKQPRPFNDEVEVGESRTFSRHPLTITIHYAHGGIILHSRQYDKKLQEYDNMNYVVHDDEEISKTIEKIIFMNSLKQ